MALTFSDLLAIAYMELGQVTWYPASGGSTTTVVNANTGIDDTDLQGHILIRRTTDSAAPQGQFQRISAYAAATGTFTVDTAFTAAVGAGDTFGYISALYPLDSVREIINMALQDLGDIDYVDTTTLDTVDNQTEYTMSVAWKRGMKRIDIQGRTGDANDNRWMTVWNYEDIPAAPGSTGLIEFDIQPGPTSRDMRIWYTQPHPDVSTYDDVISEDIHPHLAKAAVVRGIVQWMLNRTQGENPFLQQRMNAASIDLQNALRAFPVKRRFRHAGNILVVNTRSDRSTNTGEPNRVDLS